MTNLFIQMNEVRRHASAWVQRVAPKVAPTIDESGHPDRPSRDPVEKGSHHVQDNFRSATCRFRSRSTCDGRRPDIGYACDQGRPCQAQRAECQCQNEPPSPQACAPPSCPQADRRAQEAFVLEGQDQARDACHQARLTGSAGADPAGLSRMSTRPVCHCFPNGAGPVPHFEHGRGRRRQMRIPFQSRKSYSVFRRKPAPHLMRGGCRFA